MMALYMTFEAERLTATERRVLEHVVTGKTNKEIAIALGCSPRTVDFHVSNILRKYGVDSRGRLMALVLSEATS
jgi:DNA-binding CsgD family transcriptional regulator